MKTGFFFVYGTLKEDGEFAKQFNQFRISSEEAVINNMDLYNIGWFPGILPGKGTVTGELHEYKDPDEVMSYMDQIEGYAGTESDLFIRKNKVVTTKTGKKVKATIYVFNQLCEGIELIPNGIWDNNKH